MTTLRSYTLLSSLLLALGTPACSSDDGTPGSADPKGDHPQHPGTPVQTSLTEQQKTELNDIDQALASVKDLDADGFKEKYAVPFTSNLGYDPLAASGLDLIQASSLELNADENAALGKNGFVISERHRFPSFVYGYKSIYLEDLLVYVSADSILYAVHESYDTILAQLELVSLSPTLQRMLATMQSALASGAAADLPKQARLDADLYLSVAKSLLAGSWSPPVAGGDADSAKALYEGAVAHSGWKNVVLFDVSRDVDFSQFEPRGHYKDSEELSRYFRAMMWLGRIDFRILETQQDHSQVFNRRQLEAAYVLRALMNDQSMKDWKNVDSAIGTFVGEHDNMVLPELDALLADLGVADAASLAAVDDATIAQAITAGGYGTQRISSHIMINGLGSGTMPLSSTFLLFGQRYVLDSHVFSNVVYDRVQGGSVKRMMPNPLDVSFAALGNDQAGLLLGPELEKYSYASDLASMRILADAHPASYWQENLYNLWLGALRTLSPGKAPAGLPSVAGTEAWGRRLLNTQHASWAELRHDTILYVKQSYTGGASCDYPDAFVDPYPELYGKIAEIASRGAALTASLDYGNNPGFQSWVSGYFDKTQATALTLKAMAEEQQSGAPHSAEHIAFINQAVVIQEGCGEPSGFDGWYASLFFNPAKAIELDPVVADVHTQPTDEGGAPVGRVLHVGTGMPRTMVVTTNGCSGPRAYVGLVSSYFEKITENFERLDDEQWSSDISAKTPDDVPWMQPIVVR